jgi:hypothetical protein
MLEVLSVSIRERTVPSPPAMSTLSGVFEVYACGMKCLIVDIHDANSVLSIRLNRNAMIGAYGVDDDDGGVSLL